MRCGKRGERHGQRTGTMKNWRSYRAMYRWFGLTGAEEICCMYLGKRVRLALWLDGFTQQL